MFTFDKKAKFTLFWLVNMGYSKTDMGLIQMGLIKIKMFTSPEPKPTQLLNLTFSELSLEI